jgi:hypothetical protein
MLGRCNKWVICFCISWSAASPPDVLYQ